MAVTKTSRTNSGLSPFAGTWDAKAVSHLLRRVHFGVKKADLDYFKSRTLDQAITEILDVDYTVPTPPLNNYQATTVDPLVPLGQTWVNNYNSLLNGVRRRSFRSWWYGNMIDHDRTIREKMVLFWHNHFSTETVVVGWANFAYENNALLRANCLKNFKTMVKDVTLDPAMLVYLNGERNTKTAPDENYSRELQELFTLGKGDASQYTEDDVIAGARVLTGWRVNRSTGAVYFDATRHDTEDKTFSSFYNTTISGQSGAAGGDELDDLIDMIFQQEEVSKHMMRKLYRWFVYYDIDAQAEADVITPLATIFRNNNYEIRPVLVALFKSQHFFDMANRGAIVKSPADHLIGLCRTYDVQFPSSDVADQYQAWGVIASGCALLQQDIGDPPSVAGWPAYYQKPQYHELWVNSDTLPNRNQISDYLVSYGYNFTNYSIRVDVLEYAKEFSSVANPNTFIDDLLDIMHTLEVDQDQKDYMKSILLSGQVQDSYWTDAWNDYINDQSNTTKATTVGLRLINLYKYMMNLAEFQLS